MKFLKAYLNYDAISSFENVRGQVEVYDEYGNCEWESYETEKDMLDRVKYINSNKFTWNTLS